MEPRLVEGYVPSATVVSSFSPAKEMLFLLLSSVFSLEAGLLMSLWSGALLLISAQTGCR